MLKKLSLIALWLIFVPSAHAQTINAASCNGSDVLAALNSVTVDGTTVNIPACASGVTYTSQTSWTQTHSVTIQGAGNTTGSDSLGNPTGYNDQTVLINSAGGSALLQISMIPGKSLRITGISFKGDNATVATNGTLNIGGNPQSTPCAGSSGVCLRVDHLHFYGYKSGNIVGNIAGWIYAVVDHNYIDNTNPGSSPPTLTVTNGFKYNLSGLDGKQNGHAAWHDAPGFGGPGAMYFENNYVIGGTANDSNTGAKSVFRYNTINCAWIQAHEGQVRGTRWAEVYKNNITDTAGCAESPVGYYLRMGGLLMHENTVSGLGNLIEFHYDRSEPVFTTNSCHTDDAVPQGLGVAGNSIWSGIVSTSGTAVTYVSGVNFIVVFNGSPYPNCGGTKKVWPGTILNINGTNYSISTVNSSTSVTLATSAGTQTNVPYNVVSNWDFAPNTATGYPGLDQSGVGSGDLAQGAQAAIGGTGICDTQNGPPSDCTNGIYTGRWLNQSTEPIYEWLDTPGGYSTQVAIGTFSNPAMFQANRDYYAYQTAGCTGTQTTGTCAGLLSARPTTCSSLVGYWATDTQTLYQCVSNVWTVYYQPYTYPHPLVGAGTFSCSPSTQSFPNTGVGSTSSSQTTSCNNTTSGSIVISSVSLAGTNLGDFSNISNTCTGTITTGNSCNVLTTFSPSASGSRTANLSVAYTGFTGSPITIPLSGTGVTTNATLTPSLAFGPIVQNTASSSIPATLANPSTTAMVISGIAISGANASDFSQTNNCGTGIPGPGNCTINIVFKPTGGIGLLETATLTVTFTGPSGSPLTSALTGTVLQTPAVAGAPSMAGGYGDHTTCPATQKTKTIVCYASDGTIISCNGAAYIAGDTCGKQPQVTFTW
jgi:hypothetical protein